MKTLYFKATEEEINEVLQPLYLLPIEQGKFLKTAIRSNLNNVLIEHRVYLVKNVDSIGLMSDILIEDKHYSDLSDEEFINLAKEDGTVYSLNGFMEAFNLVGINSSTDVIRII